MMYGILEVVGCIACHLLGDHRWTYPTICGLMVLPTEHSEQQVRGAKHRVTEGIAIFRNRWKRYLPLKVLVRKEPEPVTDLAVPKQPRIIRPAKLP